MVTYKEPCGCRYTTEPSRWVQLCDEHEKERGARFEESCLDSLGWLIEHYEKFPNEDNLRHVITRIKTVGKLIARRPQIVAWIKANSATILRRAP